MSGACIWSDEGEAYVVSETKTVRARKEHLCCECGETIAVGDLHEHLRGLCDGFWESLRTCARCVNVRTDYFAAWTYTMMREDFRAEHGFDYVDGIPTDFAPCRDGAA